MRVRLCVRAGSTRLCSPWSHRGARVTAHQSRARGCAVLTDEGQVRADMLAGAPVRARRSYQRPQVASLPAALALRLRPSARSQPWLAKSAILAVLFGTAADVRERCSVLVQSHASESAGQVQPRVQPARAARTLLGFASPLLYFALRRFASSLFCSAAASEPHDSVALTRYMPALQLAHAEATRSHSQSPLLRRTAA